MLADKFCSPISANIAATRSDSRSSFLSLVASDGLEMDQSDDVSAFGEEAAAGLEIDPTDDAEACGEEDTGGRDFGCRVVCVASWVGFVTTGDTIASVAARS